MVNWLNSRVQTLKQVNSFLLLTCLILIPLIVPAQGGFSKRYTNNAYQSLFESSVSVAKGMNVLVATALQDSSSGRQLLQIRKIGPDGALLALGDEFRWKTDSFFYYFPYHCGARINDNEYVWLLNRDGYYGRTPHLLVTDSNGRITRQRTLYSNRCYPTDDSFFSAYAVTVDPFGNIAVGAYKSCGGKWHFNQVLLKIDRNLDLIWERKYDLFHYDMGVVFNLFADSVGFTLLGGSTNGHALHFKTYTNESGIIRTDTAGNPLWVYTTPAGKRRGYISHSAQLADGGFAFMVMEITKDRIPEAPDADWMGVVQLIKVDALGHEEWIRVLGADTSFYGSILQDGCSIAYKDSTFLLHHYESPTNTHWLKRFDLKGRLLSQRVLQLEDTSLGSFGWPSNWINMPDGSVFGSGVFYNYKNPAFPQNQGMALRLDTGLCIKATVGGCMEPVSISGRQLLPAKGLKVYPNPTRDILHVSSARDFTRLAILDVTGRVLQGYENSADELELSLKSLSPGIYFLRATNSEGLSENYRIVRE